MKDWLHGEFIAVIKKQKQRKDRPKNIVNLSEKRKPFNHPKRKA